MDAASLDTRGLKVALAVLKHFERTLADRKYQAFINAWHREEAAKLPSKSRGRRKGVSKYNAQIDKITQHPQLSARQLALIIDDRPHNQEAIRKGIERARSSEPPDPVIESNISDMRIEKLAKQVMWPVLFVSFLVDTEGRLRPARKSLESLREMIQSLEADLGQKIAPSAD